MQHSIGVIGLGVMGRNLALNMASHQEEVAIYNYTRDLTDDLVAHDEGLPLHPYYDIEAFVQSLTRPRKIFMMVTAGSAIDSVIESLLPHLEAGDIIMDGGNSHFLDTERRFDELQRYGIEYIGVGVSGGEVGARTGPAIMPGGSKEAYDHVAPILTKIAAHVEGDPCCVYIGPKGSGHFVKMVHNGIEYADMQLIAEAYSFLRFRLGLDVTEVADIFAEWNAGELKSYLIEITADILRKTDDETGQPLIDVILDQAGQKGTGKWTSLQAIDNGIASSIITEALFARYLSAVKEERVAASAVLKGPEDLSSLERDAWVERIRQALYMGKVAAYAQGFTQYRTSSELYDWNLRLEEIALIFRGGCIIRADFLNVISEAFKNDANLSNLMLAPFFAEKVQAYQESLRHVVAEGALSGFALPCLSTSLTYYDSYRTANSNANMLQAQRDYFGAHTYARTDREGIFHTDWQ